MRGVCTIVIAIAALAAAATTARGATPPPEVTVIADSVLTAVQWNAAPLSILQRGLDLHLEVGVCRRLTGVSCPYEGGNVPTLVDLVPRLGSDLGPTVAVEVGNNDYHDTFAQSVEQSISTLLAAGAQHILWVNLRVVEQQRVDMNAVLDAAARRHPQLQILDWNAYSRNQNSWFQTDGLHLTYDGAVAMATFLHAAIIGVASPITIGPAALPVARVGHPYATHLTASGGTAPYTWRVVGGALPKGLSLRPNGGIDGVPRHARPVHIVVRATDRDGRVGTHPELLRIVSGR